MSVIVNELRNAVIDTDSELKPGLQTMFQLRHDERGHFVNFILNRTERKVTIGGSDMETSEYTTKVEDVDHARIIWTIFVKNGYKRSL